MLMDLIAAPAEDAQVILFTSGHANIWPTLEATTVDHVKLACLAFILKGKPLEEGPIVEYVQTFQRLADGGEEGPWIDLVPAALVEDLAALGEEQMEAVARQWANTEEAKLDRWDAQDVASFLRELSAFTGSALAQGRDVLIWLCL
jgi:hypothetical protein